MASEERKEEPEKECVYKTKVVPFLGRTLPIILQNDNGPCPLLAICNVLLLRNNLNLSPDIAEVSQEKLLSLVAERLIDSNSNIENKDAGYVKNQQQNIADAIDLLHRLTTGLDVNIRYRRIDDFEFTPECAIFDLLDIPLYHGWIVDPQDYDTADAIGSKSYNTLMADLVALETRNVEGKCKSNLEEDCVDFAAATTATLGVPSPCLSRGRSFDDSPRSVSDQQKGRKGDLEEEEELLRVLRLSEAEKSTLMDLPLSSSANGNDTSLKHETAYLKGPKGVSEKIEGHADSDNQPSHQKESSTSQDCLMSTSYNNNLISSETFSVKVGHLSSNIGAGDHLGQSCPEVSGERFMAPDSVENVNIDALIQNKSAPFRYLDSDPSFLYEDQMHESGDDNLQENYSQNTSTSKTNFEPEDNHSDCNAIAFSGPSALNAESDTSSGRQEDINVPEAVASSIDGSEPIYEGEECIIDSGLSVYENREPMYEGEMVLAEQADKVAGDACDMLPKVELTPQKGELIRNFLRNNANQLTIYGLFCLQEGLKERELCVFFRNNHFSTMFKYNSELYLLATDQGYINQSELVWEKLNEVNGDTVFMTGEFKEFKAENHVNDAWSEQNALASTADYLASIDNSAPPGCTLNSDLQLAIALQQQEFEQQPQRPTLQQPSTTVTSKLVTGPQVSKSGGSSSSSKHEAKSKDKCIVM